MKKTLFLFIFSFTLLILGGCTDEPDRITVETVAASDLEYNSVVLHGNLSIKGTPIIKNYGFYYGTTPNPTLRVQVYDGYVNEGNTNIPFFAEIKDLQENTKYYFQAYAVDANNQIIRGEEFSFTTKPEPEAIIDYMTIKKIGTTSTHIDEYEIQGSATLQYEGYKVEQAGFVYSRMYSMDQNDVTSATKTKIPCEVDGNKINLDITTADDLNIDSGTTYVIAYMILDNGMIVISKTQRVSIYDVDGDEQAITKGVDEITYDSAKLSGSLKLSGNAHFQEYGFLYGTNTEPDIKATAGFEFLGSEHNYSLELNKLKENTKYYFQAYAIDAAENMVKGDLMSFTTTLKPGITMNDVKLTYQGKDNTLRNIYNIKGAATLNPEGYAVEEAGFLFSSYYGINDTNVTIPGTATKVPCEIKNNKISIDYEAVDNSNIYNGSTYILAYFILKDGTVMVTDTQKISID